MSVVYTIRLTSSQKMALTDVLLAYMRLGDDQPQSFIDCSQPGAPETTTVELLEFLSNAKVEGKFVVSAKQKKLFLDALAAGIELAIVRNNLEGAEIPDPSEIKRMAKDAVNAMQGIDTCDPNPVAEWNALVDAGGSAR